MEKCVAADVSKSGPFILLLQQEEGQLLYEHAKNPTPLDEFSSSEVPVGFALIPLEDSEIGPGKLSFRYYVLQSEATTEEGKRSLLHNQRALKRHEEIFRSFEGRNLITSAL